MDRTTVLAKIPTKLHASADALAAAGFDWSLILILIQKILEALLNMPKTAKAPPPGGSCDPHLANHLCCACDSACATLCACIAACEAAGCCE